MPPSGQDETLIAHLLDLPPVERATALERACAENPALRDRVFDIFAALAAAEQTGISSSASDLAPDAVARVLESALDIGPAEMTGTRIGPYKLLEEIGEGGFGVVWMAEQEEPIRRRVALKILKVGMDTREVIARFEAERQALALMDHPNIARVFDAGATEKGRPYFVMELVRGIAITRYCDQNRLSAEARLKLFMTVCQAVQHAHHKGVIHRDLKPSNILVTLHDGMPMPKVIDFGIAKATQGRLTDKTLFTHFQTFIGTPAYTSPEQMEMSGLDVDTRSDIYSLGVVLYELLTGQPPFDADALAKAGLESMRRTIREVDPPRPSRRLSTLTEQDRTAVAQQRSTDVGQLSLLLRGDLDWVVMHCLEKDRTRRYETANGLARDIERHLDNEPVAARPPTGVYRLQKFIRRHKLAFVAVTAVALSLVAGLIASSVLLVRERVAHTRAVSAEREQSRLRQHADTARVQETKRASRTALNLAGRLLAENKTADALAYFVQAARKDPENRTIAPRLASVLTSRNFLLPERAPFQCGSRVLGLRYTTDGGSVLVGTEDGTFRVFDAATGALTREVRLGQAVKRNGWIFARDDDRVCAVRFVGDTLGVLDVATGRLRFPALTLDPRVLPGEGADPGQLDAGAVSLSPDGRWLLAEGEFALWIWDATCGALAMQRNFLGWKFCAFSPDGTRFAQVTGDTFTVLSLPGGERVAGPVAFERPDAHHGEYLIPHFSRDGRKLAVVDSFKAIHVFDAATGERLQSWPHDGNFILAGMLQVLPDGRLFAECAHTTELWDFASGQSGTLAHAGWNMLTSVVADARGARVLATTSTGNARLLNAATGELIAEETSLHVSGDVVATLSPDGAQVVSGTGRGELRWLRVGRGAARPLEVPAVATGFLPDSPARLRTATLADTRVIDVRSGRTTAAVANPQSNSLRWLEGWFSPGARFLLVWDREATWAAADFSGSGAPRVVQLEGNRDRHHWTFSPEGNFVAFRGTNPRDVGVWNLSTGALAGPMLAYDNDIVVPRAFDLGANGQRLAAGHASGIVAVWDVATSRLITKLESTSRATPAQIFFSPDGQRLLVSTILGEARLWDARTGQPVSPPFEILRGGIYSPVKAFFSPEGRWFATADGEGVMLRDATTYQQVGSIPSTAEDGFFSRDGTRLCGGGDLRVWDVPTGEQITEPTDERNRPGGVWDLEFSPDARYLKCITSSHSGNVTRIRSVPQRLPDGEQTPDWLLRLATVLAGRTINDAEVSVSDPGAMAQIDDVRRELATLPDDAPFVEYGRWLLDDSRMRSIAPGFTITPEELQKFAGSSEKPAATP
ncbi:MAG: protein kinase [Opitutus sp.]